MAPDDVSVPDWTGPPPGLHAVSRRLTPARAARDVRMAAGWRTETSDQDGTDFSTPQSLLLNGNDSYLEKPGRGLSFRPGFRIPRWLVTVGLAEPPDAGGLRGVPDLADELLDHVLEEQDSMGLSVRADDAGQV